MSPTRTAFQLDKYRFAPVGTAAAVANRHVALRLRSEPGGVEDSAVSSSDAKDERVVDGSGMS